MAAEYGRLAKFYDARWNRYVALSTQATLGFLAAAQGERILDLGCGTGSLLAALPAREVEAWGVDLSRAMLGQARTKLERSLLVQGSAVALPFAAGTFDAVVSASAFHYWHPAAVAMAEISRVLRPGGRLVLTDWCDDFVFCKLCDRWLRWTDPAHLRILGSRQCRSAVAAADFEEIELSRYKISWLWGLMTVRARKPRAAA